MKNKNTSSSLSLKSIFLIKLISDVLLWTPSHGQASVGWPTRTYLQQLCTDTGCSLEDFPEVTNNGDKWLERVREIRVSTMMMMMTHIQWTINQFLTGGIHKFHSLLFSEGWLFIILLFGSVWQKEPFSSQNYMFVT